MQKIPTFIWTRKAFRLRLLANSALVHGESSLNVSRPTIRCVRMANAPLVVVNDALAFDSILIRLTGCARGDSRLFLLHFERSWTWTFSSQQSLLVERASSRRTIQAMASSIDVDLFSFLDFHRSICSITNITEFHKYFIEWNSVRLHLQQRAYVPRASSASSPCV